MYDWSDQRFGKQHEELKKILIEMVNIKSETLRLSEYTRVLKETTNSFSSKLIGNKLVILTSETLSTEATTITTTPNKKNYFKFTAPFEESI